MTMGMKLRHVVLSTVAFMMIMGAVMCLQHLGMPGSTDEDPQRLHDLDQRHLKVIWREPRKEIPYVPSPRTAQTSKSSSQRQTWMDYQKKLRKDMSNVRHVNMLFLGDSITESFVGTSYGNPCTTNDRRCRNIPQVFQAAMKAHELSSHVSAISGDQTQHLLWRLTKGGELPPSLRPDVVVVLIGTNNIPYFPVEDIAKGIRRVTDFLRKALPSSTVLVNEILPRGDNMVVKANKTESIQKVNNIIRGIFTNSTGRTGQYANSSAASRSSLQYLQCGSLFAPSASQLQQDPSQLVDVNLMPDLLHPNADGMQKWLSDCILPAALKVLPTRS
mmetsp:Transcript_8610/g.14603  ORF Transcript_8610/g.14603 Transcript_8610/m.14603 type:complete len:331 (-) Transcript_8610:183-1175(-)